jgi:hypothetical protein
VPDPTEPTPIFHGVIASHPDIKEPLVTSPTDPDAPTMRDSRDLSSWCDVDPSDDAEVDDD